MDDSLSSAALTPDHDQPPFCIRRTFLAWTGMLFMSLASLLLIAWLTGRGLSDRFLWSQYLLWIPTPLILVTTTLGLIASRAPSRRSRLRRHRTFAWVLALLAIGVYFSFVENALLRRIDPPDAGGIGIMHWTMAHARIERERQSELIARFARDITILSDAHNMPWDEISLF
ncbi:MAG: hypothetical protein O7G85_13725, partial [Planctomycetota bacterium]|nr:hypothetical protein [Planctomycetota bacterium]